MARERASELRAVTIFLLCLTWPIVLARCYVRVHIVKAFRADDWCMLGALVSPRTRFLGIRLTLARFSSACTAVVRLPGHFTGPGGIWPISPQLSLRKR